MEAREHLEDQATCLAINIVTKYLRSVVKSDKIANKFEEKILPLSKNTESGNTANKENISIEHVLKKQLSKSKDEKGMPPEQFSVSCMLECLFSVEAI